MPVTTIVPNFALQIFNHTYDKTKPSIRIPKLDNPIAKIIASVVEQYKHNVPELDVTQPLIGAFKKSKHYQDTRIDNVHGLLVIFDEQVRTDPNGHTTIALKPLIQIIKQNLLHVEALDMRDTQIKAYEAILAPQKIQANVVIEELIKTETTFIEQLKELTENMFPKYKKYLPKQMLETLTPLLETLYSYSPFEQLSQLPSTNSGLSLSIVELNRIIISTLFKDRIQTLASYAANYNNILEVLNQLKQGDKEKKLAATALSDFLILPIQRLARYPLLLEEIQKQFEAYMKHTQTQHTQHNDQLSAIIEKTKGYAQTTNELLRSVPQQPAKTMPAPKLGAKSSPRPKPDNTLFKRPAPKLKEDWDTPGSRASVYVTAESPVDINYQRAKAQQAIKRPKSFAAERPSKVPPISGLHKTYSLPTTAQERKAAATSTRPAVNPETDFPDLPHTPLTSAPHNKREQVTLYGSYGISQAPMSPSKKQDRKVVPDTPTDRMEVDSPSFN